jgi:hypothetical protein
MVSLPLVFWDTLYVFGRPHTMPGGKFHSPIWTPYALYGTIDYVYGWPAWNAHVGFTAAQAGLNIVESLAYVWYLAAVWMMGGSGKNQFWKGGFPVHGKGVGLAVLVCFAAAVSTLSKTVLYCKCSLHGTQLAANTLLQGSTKLSRTSTTLDTTIGRV